MSQPVSDEAEQPPQLDPIAALRSRSYIGALVLALGTWVLRGHIERHLPEALTTPAQLERWQNSVDSLLREGQLEQHVATGELRPVSARPLPNRAYLFSLPNDGQAREAYVRLQSSHPVMTWFKVIDDSGLVSQSRPAYLFGALFGALALLMVYNLLRFAYTVSYTHIWLSLLHGASAAVFRSNADAARYAASLVAAS